MSEWTPGLKHPETPVVIFKNVYDWDRVRRILAARCSKCGIVVTTVPEAAKALVMKCNDPSCRCRGTVYDITHDVCSVCYDMWHSLYCNVKLRNMNYWKELDEKDGRDGSEGRRRMGLK